MTHSYKFMKEMCFVAMYVLCVCGLRASSAYFVRQHVEIMIYNFDFATKSKYQYTKTVYQTHDQGAAVIK